MIIYSPAQFEWSGNVGHRPSFLLKWTLLRKRVYYPVPRALLLSLLQFRLSAHPVSLVGGEVPGIAFGNLESCRTSAHFRDIVKETIDSLWRCTGHNGLQQSDDSPLISPLVSSSRYAVAAQAFAHPCLRADAQKWGCFFATEPRSLTDMDPFHMSARHRHCSRDIESAICQEPCKKVRSKFFIFNTNYPNASVDQGLLWEKFYQGSTKTGTGLLPPGASAETCIACFYSNWNIYKTATMPRYRNILILILATSLYTINSGLDCRKT